VRTTLTLDDDVAALIRQEVRRTGAPFKTTVNEILRKGLASGEGETLNPFVVTPFPMGLKPGLSYDSISALIEELEGPYHR
jgi:hypothetical protein